MSAIDTCSTAQGAIPAEVDLNWTPANEPSALPAKKQQKKRKEAPEGEAIDSAKLPFYILGFDHDRVFFYDRERKQVIDWRASQLTEGFLLTLMSSDEWGHYFPAPTKEFNRMKATNWITGIMKSVGLFDPGRVRGCGAWDDNGRIVFHMGTQLYIKEHATPSPDAAYQMGTIIPLEHQDRLNSRYIYELDESISMLHDKPLTVKEGQAILATANLLPWERPVSGFLLTGWLFLAPICGALKWRPHFWITGGASSGKSTVLERFCKPMIPEGGFIFAAGNSTEAGLRQKIGKKAMPILIDETESDSRNQQERLDDVLVMLRQSSSDGSAQTYRGTQGGHHMSFQPRVMGLLASIGVALKQQQDIERFEVGVLQRLDPTLNAPRLNAIKKDLYTMSMMPDLAKRSATRGMNMLPTIQATIAIFSQVATRFFNSQRSGDQIGTLLAGAWCFTHDEVPDASACQEMIERFEWDCRDALRSNEQEDIINTLLGCTVKTDWGATTSIGQLIRHAAGVEEVEQNRCGVMEEEFNRRSVIRTLELFGIKVDLKRQLLRVHPSNKALQKLFAETTFATGLLGRMKRIPSADTNGNKPFRIGAVSTSGLFINLSMFIAVNDE
ncbi:hypothetical protein U9S86_004552 [Salmonella enterica]|nr:hypothetical protein [Salmonella enterica]EHA9546167.1 hypothetical protein [Salmonella enterica subsp. enterica serovar Braenderup]EBH4941549.1 hypothetical protein [Salmonella enterica]ECK3278473.1 hypothetical protein [Salmonella enterica]ECK6358141.1 hypothetical protein [Salmonella enterica]